MTEYEYLIVGGGMAADAAVAGIREVDAGGSIGLVGDEADPPYRRPPLSKDLWAGTPLDDVWCHTERYGVTMHLRRRVVALDPAGGTAVDDHGAVYRFRRVLLATGGRPRRLPFGDEHVLYFRTLADFRRLAELSERKEQFVVIGGGFIGAELAAALATHGRRVTMLFPEATIGARVFPADVGRFLGRLYAQRGVDVRAGAGVTAVEANAGELTVVTSAGELVTDAVVAGIGLQPNVELARAAGLAVADGIVVDEGLRASQPNVFAAGDVASFFNPALGRRMRVEHEDNAVTMGREAGRSMAGASVAYHHLPSFYGDLFDVGYEAVGDVDARLEVTAEWVEPYREGVLTYHEAGQVRGVLLWNVWNAVDAARRLVEEGAPAAPGTLRALLAAAA